MSSALPPRYLSLTFAQESRSDSAIEDRRAWRESTGSLMK